MSWARLFKRIFDIEVNCPNCGALRRSSPVLSLRRRTAIEDPPVINKITSHAGLPPHATHSGASSRRIPGNLSA
ncbi:MAG: hypothetical protein K2Q17_18315, partial [Nitrospiraceae bacterium]|nr:hypothetical protein [Nitrospiraceae bacterium]